MSIKGKLDETTFTGLDESLKPLYKKSGESYILDVEDMEHQDEITALKRAKDRANEENQSLQSKVTSLTHQLDNVKKGDGKQPSVEELEQSWQQKFTAMEQQLQSKLVEKDNAFANVLVEKDAISLANELFVSPTLALPHIKSRLTVESGESGYKLRVLGDDGKVSAKTLDEFKKEIVANPEFKYIIKSNNKASGGTVMDSLGGTQTQSERSYKDLSKEERLAHVKNVIEKRQK